MIDFDQYTEYKTESGIYPVALDQHALDSLLTLTALASGYAHVTTLGRAAKLDAAALDALKANAPYHADVIANEITSSNPAEIVDALIAVRSRPEWHVGRQCAVGDVVFYAGNLWTCRVPHTVTTDPNWRPDVAPNLWRRFYDPGNPAWSYPTAYTGDNTAGAGKGDIVTYNGRQYRCLQSHTSNVAWYPSAVGVINVLWVDLGAV